MTNTSRSGSAAANTNASTSGSGSDQVTVDLLIIGAGPTGLYAAYYAGFRGLTVAIADALPQTGGQISALYPEKLIYDIAGFPAIRGQDLVDRLTEQANQSNPTYLLNHSVTHLNNTDQGITATTNTGTHITAGAALICGGIGNFTPRELPTGTEYLGRGLRYFVPHLNDLAEQDVIIVGGGDSALDWALSLEPIASTVTLVHRRTQFRAHQRTVQQVHTSSIRVLTPYEIHKTSGDGPLSEVVVANTNGDEITLPAQTIVAALGFIADLGPIEQWQLQLRRRRILVNPTMRTNQQHIFAAGDIADYDGKVSLIAIGFGEAALAVNHITTTLDPTRSTTPGHSTDT
ncbi:NAD(P)/FAD-dependent oxidoreductase [Streptomyces albipurpureus]|uniref:Ferredoxin--NADP reductase n=1 Tax=Streptomyces albipurpureus TaxID=2897419 RepID=A0ABT0UTZ4_9ACTN|nr:NAD(P)/FAD-dependent oxidoreductase [Streptomyces sp. CWNU-1]MCM2391919.1 NAD(P)/FAD-dependent oxidoreductase [Streptomyces sp. CWNU-1]